MTRLRHVALLVALALAQSEPQQSQTPSWQRPRRQFPGSEWVPLSRPCPTCRPFADPSDTRNNFDDIGLVPPRPPPATRQVQGTSTFFPPQPQLQQQQQQNGFPQRPQRFPDFPGFNQFQQHTPFFTPQQQQSFLPQTYLNNHQLLLNENPQLLPLVNNPQLLNQINQQKPQLPPQQQPKENQIRFRPEPPKIDLKPPQNIRLEQDKVGPTNPPVPRLELPLNQPPTPFNAGLPGFHQQQFQFPQFAEPQQPFVQQQQFGIPQHQQFPPPQQEAFPVPQQEQLPAAPSQQYPEQQQQLVDSRVPTPATNNSELVIPGLDKEEIQLLYVPVETLRQRGQLQGHTFEEPRQPFFNQGFQQFQQLQQTPTGHFITQPPVTTPDQASNQPSSVTPPAVLTQNLPLREDSQQFSTGSVTASPSTAAVTEQVVTIHPRPLSTIGLTEGRKTTLPPRKATSPAFHSSSPYKKDIFSNEVTPSFSSSGSDVTRGTQQPLIETATEITIPTTTLQPHQPHLSIYIGQEKGEGRVKDILHEIKSMDVVPVIDSFQTENPSVFVGPGNLNPPQGFNRYELPYLSNLEPSRIEQRDNLPFFVAPLNFNVPQGYTKVPFPSPHVGAVVFLDEQELEAPTTTTTTIRPRGRRPSSGQYKQQTRRPVSRQRVTPRPQETASEDIESQKTNQDVLREQPERRRPNTSRRQRVRTTTEAVTESDSSDSSIRTAIQPQEAPVQLNAQLMDFDATQVPQPKLQEPVHSAFEFNQEQPQMSALQQPSYPQDDFVPPPHPSVFDVRPNQNQAQFQQETPFEVFHPSPEEIKGMFNLPSTDSDAQYVSSTVKPTTFGYQEQDDRTPEKVEKDNESDLIEKEVEAIEIPKKKSKYSGVKQPNLSQLRSQVRSRPRGSSTTTGHGEDESQYENAEGVTGPATETSKTTPKFMSNFNRSRKPLRTTTSKPETTSSSTPTRGYTVKPLRRATLRTSLSTKRMRKPTTSPPEEEEAIEAEKLNDSQKFVPSAASNEIDEHPVSKLRPRKPFFPKKYTEEPTTSSSLSTKTYQERNDEEDYRQQDGNDSPVTSVSAEGGDGEIRKTESKKGRRRLRVKVQKRPQDNFETAESQNHGAVSNLLVQGENPTAPDLYRFGKGEFDFQDTKKFIATQNKEYTRNITADILENTHSFSSPGSDTTVQLVTIVSEQTTVMPDASSAALVSNDPAEEKEEQGTTPVPDVTTYQETTTTSTTTTTERKETTRRHDEVDFHAETTTENIEPTTYEPDLTTTTTTTTAAPELQRKVLKTSTTTQVSHETEICYKGKCIKTNSDNPDAALKRLVEEANAEEAAKVKT